MSLNIQTSQQIEPKIYAYITPDNIKKQGWIKIGYTENDTETRIKQQTHTAGIKPIILWEHEARFDGGGYFKDYDFHSYLTKNGVKREKGTEWFLFNGGQDEALNYFYNFKHKNYKGINKKSASEYILRDEQKNAVEQTMEYFTHYQDEFLWNAKPRFGKTLTTYDLVRKMDLQKVLIVTNRPSIANSWFDDYEKYISWQTSFYFVSESSSLKDRVTLTRQEFKEKLDADIDAKCIEFVSLQDLKGSKYFGGNLDKLEWIAHLEWDMLIIDEAHEAIDTFKTDIAFDKIKRKFTLHLSGTPFKALASGKFNENQIFNWTYEDEQLAKKNWNRLENNPYETLPKLNMYTYQMSSMISDRINEGAQIDKENMDYAFDLNEFFATNDKGQFIHKADVEKWLDTLTKGEKYPFSTHKQRNELKHTLWLLDRVASARALQSLLKQHPTFENYEIILAAGDGKAEGDYVVTTDTSLNKVKNAIKKHDKTITLSVGQLTTGITIPEWTAVLMLSNMKSPALYMQAAFRAQNPYEWTINDGQNEIRYKKEDAYVFDFAPERTLIIFDEFANNLSTKTNNGKGTLEERKVNIKRLLNFFPVIGEDQDGKMIELSAEQVMSIPKTIKATEVVKRGFMSNLLFSNISNIFSAPSAALDILNRLPEEKQGKSEKVESIIDTNEVEVDDQGEVKVSNELVISKTDAIFGEKVFDFNNHFEESEIDLSTDRETKLIAKNVSQLLKPHITEVQAEYQLSNKTTNRVVNQIQQEIEYEVKRLNTETNIKKAHLENEYKKSLEEAVTTKERIDVKDSFTDNLEQLLKQHTSDLATQVNTKVEELKKDIVYEEERKIEEKKKNTIQDEIRSRLRGFSRTIPSFIMAYGDDNLTLNNFDQYTPENVFEEVTGITLEEFKFLRDGGTYTEEGVIKQFKGGLFDEVVFNESIKEFLNKKVQLANYFEDNKEDIFDYIPPQKTNQIFTPKKVVIKMVDDLENENPGIYDDSSKTFSDLYMKSGLYITEIVKRLFNSDIIKNKIPDDHERLKHILENQVYGLAPSEIIYNIATNFIFGNLDKEISRKNFKHFDIVPHTKTGNVEEVLSDLFEKN
ncbi:DEAD/DEAH box helicase family protein [Macrococcus carouselicus]|uniref:Restriction endonuclease n=1 Tax=Macrococcus carouselicus TaxID=69969 RepID=A0A9Q8CM65_9STAP|nr:DEAD/DEAH box helicase family protein [Macrococcus carouselicus]TDM04690.1 restriction endonuclease [Macrococcus carouselicus]